MHVQEAGVFVNSGAAVAFSFTTVCGLVGVAARLTGGLLWPGFPPFAFAFQCRCFVACSVLSDSSPTLQRVKLVVINCFICIVCLLIPLLSKGKWILVDVFAFLIFESLTAVRIHLLAGEEKEFSLDG